MVPPPSRDGRPPQYALHVFRLDFDQTVVVRLLEDHFRGCMTHWHRDRGHYCKGPDCPPQIHKLADQWKGYLAAEAYDQRSNLWYPIVLEATENLELDFRRRSKRGQVWKIWRDPKVKGKPAKLHGELLETLDPKLMPACFDVLPVVRSMYHVYDLVLNVKNPLPDRTFVEPSAGPAPAIAVEASQTDAVPSQEERRKIRDILARYREARFKHSAEQDQNGQQEKGQA